MNLSLWPSGGAGGDSRDQSTVQEHPLGQRAVSADGSVFRYVKAASGAALVAGNSIQGPAIVTTHLAMTAVATAIGATQVTVALGATNNATANQYAEGFLQVDTTPGNGYAYRVASHPAIALSTSGVITLYPDEGLIVALTSASKLGLIASPYNNCIQTPVTTATGKVVGIAASALAASSYGWVQSRGVCCPLIANTPALGGIVISPGTAAGALEVSTAVTLLTGQIVGYMLQIGVNAKNNAVYLTID